jgi:hypothetical protein
MGGQPYCVWCNQTGHPATVECHAAYKKRLEPTDIVERLRTKHVFGAREIDQQRQDAADLIESLRAKLREAEEEVAEWKQAASVEAGLRREFATQVEEVRTLASEAYLSGSLPEDLEKKIGAALLRLVHPSTELQR